MVIDLVLLTRLDMSKLIGALCSVLSVRQLNERQFSSSMAESLDALCCILTIKIKIIKTLLIMCACKPQC